MYLEDEQLFNDSVSLNGPRPFTMSGRGAAIPLRAYLDEELLFSAMIDFTAEPPRVSNQTNHLDGDPRVPNVVGMREAAAIERLNEAGFENVQILYVNTPGGISGWFASSGEVARQIPSSGSRQNTNVQVVLEVYE
jgi:hypothetical protein